MFGKDRGESGRSCIQLENENKKLELQIMTSSDQLDNFRKISFKYQQDYNKLAKSVNSLCIMLLDSDYAKKQLGGSNPLADLDVFSMIQYAVKEYQSSHTKERQLLIDLTNQIQQKSQQIEGLKAQVSQYMLKEQQLADFDMNPENTENMESTEKSVQQKPNKKEDVSKEKINSEDKSSPIAKAPGGIMKMSIIDDEEEEITMMPASKIKNKEDNHKYQNRQMSQAHTQEAFNKGTTVQAHSKPQIKDEQVENEHEKDNGKKDLKISESSTIISSKDETGKNKESEMEKLKSQVEAKTEHQKENDIMAHVVDLNDYISNMSDIMWQIVLAIGKKGLSESKDIKRDVAHDDVTESAFNTGLSQLRKMNIINQERINTGWRWFYSFELSDIGNRIYLEKYKESPIVCEKQILKKEHTTALHGYCIKDTAYIIKVAFGYDEAVTVRRSNSIKLYSGETYIPDVIAKKKQNSIVDYFEVELGHHTQKDFNTKCDKMRMVTKNLYFVVPDADTMNRILARQIGQWVLEKGGKDKLKGTTVYLTTLTKLNERKWENIYPFE